MKTYLIWFTTQNEREELQKHNNKQLIKRQNGSLQNRYTLKSIRSL